MLRATARDKAGNQNSTNLRLDGRPMEVTLPLRTPTLVTSSLLMRRTIHGRPRRHKGGRRRPVPVQRARVQLGRRVRVVGQVRTRSGQGLPAVEVQLLSRNVSAAEQQLAVVRTDGRGRFSYVVRASATSVLRAVYTGSPTTLPSQHEVGVLVPAASTIVTRPHRVLNGGSVTFRGRLRSLPVPALGKLVELQVVLSSQWQTFRTVRTDLNGSWEVGYHFRRTCGRLRYRFRAKLPAEAGYAFEGGHTRGVTVRVRGAPCQ